MTVVAVGLEWTAWFEVVAAEASLAVSAVLDVVFADSGVAAGSSAVCLVLSQGVLNSSLLVSENSSEEGIFSNQL